MSNIIDNANFHAEVNTELLERLLIHGDNEKVIRGVIAKVLKDVRGKLSMSARAALPNDPRQAYRAVKHSVYKTILGGNVSILNSERKSGKAYPVPEQKPRFARGGNRTARSRRTEDLMSYFGTDRGFILRFLNSGTSQRQSRYGNRGSISARNWFPGAAHAQMEQAAQVIADLVSQEITNRFNNNGK